MKVSFERKFDSVTIRDFPPTQVIKFIQFIISDATRLPTERAQALRKPLPDFTFKLFFMCI